MRRASVYAASFRISDGHATSTSCRPAVAKAAAKPSMGANASKTAACTAGREGGGALEGESESDAEEDDDSVSTTGRASFRKVAARRKASRLRRKRALQGPASPYLWSALACLPLHVSHACWRPSGQGSEHLPSRAYL